MGVAKSSARFSLHDARAVYKRSLSPTATNQSHCFRQFLLMDKTLCTIQRPFLFILLIGSRCVESNFPSILKVCFFFRLSVAWSNTFSSEFCLPHCGLAEPSHFSVTMKAMLMSECRPVSPRSKLLKAHGVRKSSASGRKCQPEFASSSSSSTTTEEEVDTMKLLFDKLVQMIPSIPKERKVSRLEILQHVIAYIQDLESQMDCHPDAENLCSGLNYLRISLQAKAVAL